MRQEAHQKLSAETSLNADVTVQPAVQELSQVAHVQLKLGSLGSPATRLLLIQSDAAASSGQNGGTVVQSQQHLVPWRLSGRFQRALQHLARPGRVHLRRTAPAARVERAEGAVEGPEAQAVGVAVAELELEAGPQLVGAALPQVGRHQTAAGRRKAGQAVRLHVGPHPMGDVFVKNRHVDTGDCFPTRQVVAACFSTLMRLILGARLHVI